MAAGRRLRDTGPTLGRSVIRHFGGASQNSPISERTKAGLASARARGHKGGAPFKMTAAKVRFAMAAMGNPETKIGDLCRELGVSRQTLYRHVGPNGSLRNDGEKLLKAKHK